MQAELKFYASLYVCEQYVTMNVHWCAHLCRIIDECDAIVSRTMFRLNFCILNHALTHFMLCTHMLWLPLYD